MKKKLAAALICLSMAAASLTACGGDTTSTPAATQEAAKTETPAAGGEAASGDVKKITEAIAEGPIILTSVGQSADTPHRKRNPGNVGAAFMAARGRGQAPPLQISATRHPIRNGTPEM